MNTAATIEGSNYRYYRRMMWQTVRSRFAVALDLLAVCAMAACGLAAVSTGRALFLDVALGFALVAFVGTVAWARAVEAGTDHGEGER